jgi:hypothetical protein
MFVVPRPFPYSFTSVVLKSDAYHFEIKNRYKRHRRQNVAQPPRICVVFVHAVVSVNDNPILVISQRMTVVFAADPEIRNGSNLCASQLVGHFVSRGLSGQSCVLMLEAAICAHPPPATFIEIHSIGPPSRQPPETRTNYQHLRDVGLRRPVARGAVVSPFHCACSQLKPPVFAPACPTFPCISSCFSRIRV